MPRRERSKATDLANNELREWLRRCNATETKAYDALAGVAMSNIVHRPWPRAVHGLPQLRQGKRGDGQHHIPPRRGDGRRTSQCGFENCSRSGLTSLNTSLAVTPMKMWAPEKGKCDKAFVECQVCRRQQSRPG